MSASIHVPSTAVSGILVDTVTISERAIALRYVRTTISSLISSHCVKLSVNDPLSLLYHDKLIAIHCCY